MEHQVVDILWRLAAKLDIINAAGETALAHGLRSDFNEDCIKGSRRIFCDHHGMQYLIWGEDMVAIPYDVMKT